MVSVIVPLGNEYHSINSPQMGSITVNMEFPALPGVRMNLPGGGAVVKASSSVVASGVFTDNGGKVLETDNSSEPHLIHKDELAEKERYIRISLIYSIKVPPSQIGWTRKNLSECL
jgi:hypothetical protein